MKISYDAQLRIAGLGLVPWNRLGPQQWLTNYAIASLYGWDSDDLEGVPPVFALQQRGTIPDWAKMNTQSMIRDPAFQQLLNEKLPGYDLMTYRPVTVPEPLADRKFLMVDPSFTARYENKVHFREQFSSQLRFPEFTVSQRQDLQPTQESFEKLMAGRQAIIIQDEQLGGGKGSFIVRDFAQYSNARAALVQLSKHEKVVVSSLVQGARERTIQCCVTSNEVFTGPLQRQIVNDPALVNPAIPQGDKFCGAQIVAEDQDTESHHEAQEVGKKIGSMLQAEGYRGIFGVDFLLDARGTLFVIEINPRITGVTPLLTALYGPEEGVPFYLLHLLELGGYGYDITDSTATFNKEGALLLIHSLETETVMIDTLPVSGTYQVVDGRLHKVNGNVQLHKLQSGQFVLQEYISPGVPVKPGNRLVTLQYRSKVIDTNTGKLYNDTVKTITAVRKAITTHPI